MQKFKSVVSRRLQVQSLELRRLLAGPSLYLGTNLDPIRDYGSVPFVNVMNLARSWQTANADGSGAFNSNRIDDFELDTNGWPTQIPFEPADGSPAQLVHTIVPVYGPGEYTLIAEGTGELLFRGGGGMLVSTSPYQRSRVITLTGGRQEIPFVIHDTEFGDGFDNLFLYIQRSDPSDPITDLDLVMPGSLETYQADPFVDDYTDGLQSFGNLRFMEWNATNNSTVVSWADRTTEASATQAGRAGGTYESMIDLSNQLQQDPWITIPARANDDYVRQLAILVRDRLDPGLKVFVEYSNETWNSTFNQSSYVQSEGLALSLDSSPFTAGQKFVAKRSAEIWSIFDQEFGTESADRIVKVLASQSNNPFVSETRLAALTDPAINPTGIMPDTLAVASYFGFSVADDLVREGLVNNVTVDQIIDRLRTDLETRVPGELAAQKAFADQYDLWLITYEAGQHLIGTFANLNNNLLTEKLIAVNRDPRMYQLYQDHLDLLVEYEVALNSNFNYVYEPNRFGSWGLKENQRQSIDEAHKYRAVIDWIADNPPQNMTPRVLTDASIETIDDGDGSERIELDASRSRDFDGRILHVNWYSGGELIGSGATIDADFSVGAHVVTAVVTDDSGETSTTDVNVVVAPSTASSILAESDFAGPTPGNFIWNSFSQLNPSLATRGWSIGTATGDLGLRGVDSPGVVKFSGNFGPVETTLADAIATNAYLSFTIGVDDLRSADWMDLNGAAMTFAIQRDSFFAAKRYAITASVDGFFSDRVLFDTNVINSQGVSESFTFNLPLDGFFTEDPIEFRIYAYQGRYHQKASSLNSFSLNGSTRAAPDSGEPPVSNELFVGELPNPVDFSILVAPLSSIAGIGSAAALPIGVADNDAFTIVGGNLHIRAGIAIDFETKSSYEIAIDTTDTAGLPNRVMVPVNVIDEVEVSDVVINDGAVQRSRVTSVEVIFEGQVAVDSDAFTVINRSSGALVGYSLDVPVFSDGHTRVRLQFAGSQTEFGSLVDGNYQLTILPSKVTSQTGQNLDDSFVYGDRAVDQFYRLFADLDGDRLVGPAEFTAMRAGMFSRPGDADFIAALDYDDNGEMNPDDFAMLRLYRRMNF